MKIKLDPVTRLEGHMKVEVELDSNNRVIDAKSTGNMFRGFENLLRGRDPRDAVHLTQRICGLCPVSHAIASAKSIEASRGFRPTQQARILRNLIQGGNFIQDHILQFYHLTLLDYVKGPDKAPWVTSYDTDLRFTKSDNDKLFNNYVKALEIRRKAHEMVAIFAGKIPHVMSIMPGGVTKQPTAAEINQYKALLAEVKSFIDNEYQHDVQKLASVYSDYYNVGAGYRNFLSLGVFELEANNSTNTLFKQGRYTNGQYSTVDTAKIIEDISHGWYSGSTTTAIKDSTTNPDLNKAGAYTWTKATRYQETTNNVIPYEVGPLARAWINGDYRNGVSVMDRHMARMLETRKLANSLTTWTNEVVAGGQEYNSSLHSLPSAGEGMGITEAPRGALVHYIRYNNSVIANYQVVTATCWNVSPKDNNGMAGPLEKALIGVTVKDKNNPIELMRIIHSFDPCTACAVHVIDSEKQIASKFVVGTPNPKGIL